MSQLIRARRMIRHLERRFSDRLHPFEQGVLDRVSVELSSGGSVFNADLRLLTFITVEVLRREPGIVASLVRAGEVWPLAYLEQANAAES